MLSNNWGCSHVKLYGDELLYMIASLQKKPKHTGSHFELKSPWTFIIISTLNLIVFALKWQIFQIKSLNIASLFCQNYPNGGYGSKPNLRFHPSLSTPPPPSLLGTVQSRPTYWTIIHLLRTPPKVITGAIAAKNIKKMAAIHCVLRASRKSLMKRG